MPMFRFIARCVAFVVILGVVAEIFFRTVIPAASLPGSYMGRHDEIFRFDTTWVTSGKNTRGRFGLRPTTWRVNNVGWNSPFDYTSTGQTGRPLIALLGDSYIEGFPVNSDQHLEVYLHRLTGDGTDVYAFGRSGWYLEQYVALSRYVDQRFAPGTFVIFLNSQDIYDSLKENGVKTPYAYQIVQKGSGFRELRPPSHFILSERTKLLRRSAIVRYVRSNLGILWGQKNAVIEDVNLGPGDASAGQVETASPLIQAAADFMVARLVKEHPGRRFVFVVDGDRHGLYAGRSPAARPEFEALRRAARPYPNVHFLDLQPVFTAAYRRDHRRFEVADGNHWNAYGNQVVAQALYGDLKAHGLLPATP
jgi:hypothetical protein